ncbi:MAG: hypothetical protein ACYCZJ_02610 [Sulfuriferula sp.]
MFTQSTKANPDHHSQWLLQRYLHGLVLLIGLTLVSLPLPAPAHSNEYLDTIKGDHGGKLRMAEQYHFEMLLANGEVHMWVTDHADRPQSTMGAAGNVKLVTDTGIVAVKLTPSGANSLVGKNSRIQPAGLMRAVATVTMKGQKPLQIHFQFDNAVKK